MASISYINQENQLAFMQEKRNHIGNFSELSFFNILILKIQSNRSKLHCTNYFIINMNSTILIDIYVFKSLFFVLH
jgi:hypothetical protein